MPRIELASQSDMHIESMDGNDGTEIRWCIFTKGKRGPIAKIIVDTRPRKVQSADYEPTAHIVNVHVRPEFRGKQLGEHLVRLAQNAMKANGFIWMTLEAEENVEFHGKLVNLYRRCGFEIYPPSDHFPLEYNGDECFRKVPMRCRLEDILDVPEQVSSLPSQPWVREEPQPVSPIMSSSSSAGETTTTTLRDVIKSRFLSSLLVQEMRREAMSLFVSLPFNLTIPIAMDWIDQHLSPGALELALRSGHIMRNKGHPDWMELAAYLRFIGYIQEKWTNWHAPFMVEVQDHGGLPMEPERQSDDEDDVHVAIPSVKAGSLPREMCTLEFDSMFVDPERYSQEGVDEALLTWSPNEYGFLALTFGDRCSAPKEMAQLLRYWNCSGWLDTDDYAYLESFGDGDLKHLAKVFREALREADVAGPLEALELDESRTRFLELVDKYASDVRLL